MLIKRSCPESRMRSASYGPARSVLSWPLWKRFAVYPQYFVYPIVGLVLSVLPAFEAHTRLLFGRYLEYRVTEKV